MLASSDGGGDCNRGIDGEDLAGCGVWKGLKHRRSNACNGVTMTTVMLYSHCAIAERMSDAAAGPPGIRRSRQDPGGEREQTGAARSLPP